MPGKYDEVVQYNKLVRDGIPDKIARLGKPSAWHVVADDQEFRERLKAKLLEEADEFLEVGTADELADLLEVIDAIAAHCGLDREDVARLQAEKRQKYGGFDKRIILEWS
jgi:predicted house-cleaning noncanonical NTP pyrophosphatase (MazG superfamily)